MVKLVYTSTLGVMEKTLTSIDLSAPTILIWRFQSTKSYCSSYSYKFAPQSASAAHESNISPTSCGQIFYILKLKTQPTSLNAPHNWSAPKNLDQQDFLPTATSGKSVIPMVIGLDYLKSDQQLRRGLVIKLMTGQGL